MLLHLVKPAEPGDGHIDIDNLLEIYEEDPSMDQQYKWKIRALLVVIALAVGGNSARGVVTGFLDDVHSRMSKMRAMLLSSEN